MASEEVKAGSLMTVVCMLKDSPVKRPCLPMTVSSGLCWATTQVFSFSFGAEMENPCIMMRGGSFGCDAQAPRAAHSVQTSHPVDFILISLLLGAAEGKSG